jgi:hypothetical protein
MAAPYATPGSRCPVFVAGIKYRSIFEAALQTEISQFWLTKSIKRNNGAPGVVKNQMVITEFWVMERVKEMK